MGATQTHPSFAVLIHHHPARVVGCYGPTASKSFGLPLEGVSAPLIIDLADWCAGHRKLYPTGGTT